MSLRSTTAFFAALIVLGSTAPVAAQTSAGNSRQDAERQKNALLKKGQLLQYNGEREKAIALYRKAAARKPADLGATLLLAGLLRRQGRVKQARQAWDRWISKTHRKDALQVASRDLLVPLLRAGDLVNADAISEAWLWGAVSKDRFAVMGDAYWRHEYKVRAIQHYTRHLAMVPRSRRVLRRVVSWHKAAGLVKAILGAYRLYLWRSPDDLDVTRKLVRRLAQPRHAAEVGKVWARWLASSTLGIRHKVVGDHYRAAGDEARAETHYLRHLERHPSDMKVLRYLSGILGRQGKNDRLVAPYRRATEATSDLDVMRQCTEALWRMGHRAAAEKTWSRWLSRSRDLDRLKVAASFYTQVGARKKAIALYGRYLSRRPGEAATVRSLAKLYLEAGRKEHAARIWRRYLTASRDSDRFKVAAEHFMKADQPTRAVPLAKRHVQLNPKSLEAHKALARALRSAGKTRQAAAVWNRAARTLTDEDRFQEAGDFYREARLWSRAATMYRRQVKHRPKQLSGYKSLAGVLQLAGKGGEAKAVWERAVRSSSDTDRFEEAAGFFRKTGKLDRAVAMLRRHLQLNPNRWACKSLAEALSNAGKPKQADALWERAVNTLRDKGRFESAGDHFLNRGQLKRAVAMYRKHLAFHPKSVQAVQALARGLRKAGKVTQAAALWEKAVVKLFDKERLDRAADFFKSIGRHKRAVALYRRYLAKAPGRIYTRRSLADALLSAGKPEEAVAMWRRAMSAYPEDDCFRYAGEFFLSSGRHDLAMDAFQRWIKKSPGMVRAHGSLVRALLQAGKSREAAVHLEKNVNRLTDDDRHGSVGDLWALMGRWDRAVPAYRDHLLRNPQELWMTRKLAWALVRAGKEREAVALWVKAARALTHEDKHQHAAAFYQKIGRGGRAVASYRRHLAQNPTSLQAHRHLAKALRGAGRMKQATAVWERAVRRLTDQKRFSWAGDHFKSAGNLKRAESMYRKDLTRNPADRSAYDSLADVLLLAGKKRKAVALWERALLVVTNPYRYTSAARFFVKIGRPGRALALYRKYLALNPDDRGAYDSVADLLLDMGKPAEAVSVWDRGLKTCSDTYRFLRAGWLHQKLGNLKQAATHKRRYMQKMPGELIGYQGLADALMAAGKTAAAERVWRRGLRTGVTYRFGEAASFYHRIGKVPRALPLYRKQVAADPTSCHAYRGLARGLVAAGKIPEADRTWRSGLKLCKDVYGMEYAADHYRDTGRFGEAARLYRTYLRSRPMDSGAFKSLVQVLVAAGRANEAEAELLRAAPRMGIKLRLLALGRFHGHRGHWSKAIGRFKKYLAVAPGSSTGYRYLAGAYLAVGRKSDAEAVWKRGLGRCTERYCAGYAADFYQIIGRCDLAVPLYKKLIAADRRNVVLHRRLARCHAKQGKTARARRHLEAASTFARHGEGLAPSDYFAFNGEVHFHASRLNSAAWTYLVHGGNRKLWKRALTIARRAAAMVPTDTNVRGTLIIALHRNGRAAEALPLVKRRLKRNVRSAWAHLEAALIYNKLGKKDRARLHLARSRKLRLIPDTSVEEFDHEVVAGLIGSRNKLLHHR